VQDKTKFEEINNGDTHSPAYHGEKKI